MMSKVTIEHQNKPIFIYSIQSYSLFTTPNRMIRKVKKILKSQSNGMNSKVSQLESMGFDKTQATNALEASNGNLQEATHFLLTNQEAVNEVASNARSIATPRATGNNRAGQAAADRAKTAASRFGTNRAIYRTKTNTSIKTNADANLYSSSLSSSSSSKKTNSIMALHPNVKIPTKMEDKSKEEQILRCSKRLAAHPLAVDTLLQALMHVRDEPYNDKYRKVDTTSQGFVTALKDKPGALDLFKAMNFTERNAGTQRKDLILPKNRIDPALLYLGISALEQIRKTEEYLYQKSLIQFQRDITNIINGSNLNANVDAEQELIKRANNLSLVPSEPSLGTGALLQVNLGPTKSNADNDATVTTSIEKVQKISRRFDGDDTLQNIIHWIGAHGSIIPSKIESREWCIVDLNKFPIEPIGVNINMGRTLQFIGCWPSGRLEIRPSTKEWREELG